jgi:hypothetical protein
MVSEASQQGQLAQRFEAALADAFRNKGWHVELPKSQLDLLVERGSQRYAVELRVVSVPRRREAMAFLADAHLRARSAAQRQKARPLAIIGAPSISPALARDLTQYAAEHLNGEPWGYVDASRLALFGAGLEDVRIEPFPISKRLVPPSRFDAFSDLNQWMLKVLLAPKVEPQYMAEGIPREPIRNASMLAQIANVSVPSASRFVAHFRHAGFLEDGRYLRLVQVRKLLELWRVSVRSSADIGVRWLLPSSRPAASLNLLIGIRDARSRAKDESHPQRYRLCLGLFSACDALHLGFVEGAPQHLEVDSIEYLLEDAEDQIRFAEKGEQVDLWVRQPHYPQSVFRGMVWPYGDGRPSADVIQCWLEVKGHPARGLEQAEFLESGALAKLFGDA